MTDLQPVIESLIEAYRERVDFMRIETATILRMRGICRRFVTRQGMTLTERKAAADELYDALKTGAHPDAAQVALYLAHHATARDNFHRLRLAAEKRMRKLARELPVWPFVESVCGFGDLGLAQIVAEAGDLSNYAGPAKLWKRFGLAVIGGERQRKVANDPALAIAHGYSPTRRSLVFVIGDSLIKKQNRYRDLYLARKEVERAKAPDAPKMAHHRRAKRYVEKRLLRDLWRAWRNLPLDPVDELLRDAA